MHIQWLDIIIYILHDNEHNFLAANAIQIWLKWYSEPPLWGSSDFFPQLFRSQPFLETEKAMIMGKTVSSTADILCCLSDPGIEKPVVCMCDVSMHTYVKYTCIYTYNF